jgi:oryzin
MQSFTSFLALAAVVVPYLAQAAPVASATEPFPTIPGKWIVTLKPNVDTASVASHHVKVREIHARNIARRSVSVEEIGGVEHQYGFGTFNGYSGSFDDATVAELNALDEVRGAFVLALKTKLTQIIGSCH